MPPPPAGAPSLGSSDLSTTINSVVKTIAAIEAAFWIVDRATLADSTIQS
jgi:hypothetical protein